VERYIMAEVSDEANATPDNGEGQTEEVQGTTPEAGQDAAAVEQPIVVGNQSFANQAALIEAYVNSQKGFTQHTQRTAKELEAYKATTEWLNGLKKDPGQWDRFLKYVTGKHEQPAATPAAPTAAQPDNRFDDFKADIDGRLEAQNAQLEYLQFRHAHQDLQDDVVAKVIDKVDEWLEQGKDRTMEEAYRWIMAEEKLSQSFSAGQKQATQAQAASKAAGGVLGGTAPAAQAAQKADPKYRDMKSVTDQNSYISRMLKSFKK
jgi:hypothetical protein